MLNVFNSHFLINYVANLSLCVIQCHGRDRPNSPSCAFTLATKSSPTGGRACCPACTFILWYVLLLQIGLTVTSDGTENGKSEWDGRRSWVC